MLNLSFITFGEKNRSIFLLKQARRDIMQVTQIASFNPQGQMQGTQATALTDDQRDRAQEIIANYDLENFSQEDALSLRKELKAEGINPRQMQKMLKELPSPEQEQTPQSTEDIKEANNPKAVLMDLLQQKESGVIEEKDFTSSLAEMKIESVGALLNIQA